MSLRSLFRMLLAAICFPLLSPQASADPASDARPNFLFIYTDDQRWDGMGVCQREEGDSARFPWIRTPNMDKLASQGVRFRNAFVVNSLCSPSRATYLTGRYSHLNGVANNHTPLPENSVTYATLLQKAGYATGFVGKFHMGNQRGQRPGFDFSASFIGQGRYLDCPFEVNGVSQPTKGWVDDVSTDFAIDFLKKNQAKPFVLAVAFKTCHGPWEPAERYKDLYSGDAAKPAPNANSPAIYKRGAVPATRPAAKAGEPLPPGPDEAAAGKARAAGKGSRDEMIRNYFRTITGADEDLGRILKVLDDLNLADNTIVIFSTDNGYYLGDHGLGDKRSAYEEALRIPLIIRYPRMASTRGQVCNAMTLNLDLAPTLLDFAGVPIPPEMQGRSWKPLLENPTDPPKDWRTSFFYEYFYERGSAGTPTITAVRTFEAKLVHYPGHPEWSELFELNGDPIEVRNLFNDASYGEMRKEMEAEFEKQSKAVSYRVPTWADDPATDTATKPGKRGAAPSAAAPAGPPPNAWVLDYRFDTDRDGKVIDASGHDNTGSLHGDLPIADGREGHKAQQFDGKGYIDIPKSASLNPAGLALAVEVTFKADKANGILLARGGKTNGYCLYLDAAGKPVFALNATNRAASVAGPEAVGDGWTTIVAKLTAEKQLVLLVNGQVVAHAAAESFIPADPRDGMQIGTDLASPVVTEKDLGAFVGWIEHVRVYSGDLP